MEVGHELAGQKEVLRGESEFEKCTLSVKLTFWGRGGKSIDA